MEIHIPGLIFFLLVASCCSALPDFHLGGSGQSRIGGNVTAHGSTKGIGASVGGGVGTDLEGKAGLNNYTVEGKVGGDVGGETGAHAGFEHGLTGTVNGTGVTDYHASIEGRKLKPSPPPPAPNGPYIPVYPGGPYYVPGPYPGPMPYPYVPNPGMPYPYVQNPMQGPQPYFPNPAPYAPNPMLPGQYPYAPNSAPPAQYLYAQNPAFPGQNPYPSMPTPQPDQRPSNNGYIRKGY